MYERFSDRARKTMQLANQASQKWNHEWVGVEHILLGLLKMENSMALSILESLGIDKAAVEVEVNALLKMGPEMVTMGKLPSTPRAKKAIEFAIDFAKTWDDKHVGTEHLLIGLARDPEGIAGQVLNKFGATVETIRNALLGMTAKKPEAAGPTVASFQIGVAIPFWNKEAQKSAVETARDVVKAMIARKLRANDLTDKELACYNKAIELLFKQMDNAIESLLTT